jgi:ABC-type multidrug transport system fused ATPase/permease subunit
MLLQQLLKSMESLSSDKGTVLMWASMILGRGLLEAHISSLSMWYSRRCFERTRGELIMSIYEKVALRKMIVGNEKQKKSQSTAVPKVDEGENGLESVPKTINGNASKPVENLNGESKRATPKPKTSSPHRLSAKMKLLKELIWATRETTAKATGYASSGQVLNLIRSDATDVAKRFMEIQRMIKTTFGTFFAIYLIWRLLGWSSLLAVALIVTAQSLNLLLTRWQLRWQRYRRKATDERVQINSQFIQVIRHLRWYGWEKTWLAKVMASRQHELNVRIVSTALNIFSYVITVTAGVSLPAVTFLVFTKFSGHKLRIDLIFPAIQLLQYLRNWLRGILTMTRLLLDAHVAMGRIENFLDEPEKEHDESREDRRTFASEPRAIKFENCNFAWPGTDVPVLHRVTLEVGIGMTVVYGPIGGGKTALLQAILGEMEDISGKSSIPNEMIGYCSQTPWLQSISIRDNILFFSPYDEERYQTVLEACALLPDLESFENGDLSQIGEK